MCEKETNGLDGVPKENKERKMSLGDWAELKFSGKNVCSLIFCLVYNTQIEI